MSHKQHGRLERERESKQEKEQPFSQLLNKKKSEESAIASPFVKQKLKQVILHRLDRAALLRKPEQDLNQSERISNSFYSDCFEDNPLRRTVSEPILKVKSKRSLTCRQNPLQRKTSAPPAVRESDIMGVVSSSASRWNKAGDMETQNYGPAQSQEISDLRGHQAELPQIVIQSHIPLPVASQNWAAVHLHSQVLPVSPHVLAVPVMYPVMSHRPLFKTKSAPSYIQHTHIHTQTVEFTHPIHDQHPTCPQEEIQQHTLSNKVPFCVGPMSQGEQYDEERAEKERLMGWNESYRERDLLGSSDNSFTNRPIRRPQRRNNKSLPSRLSSHLSQSIINKLNYNTGLVYDSQMLKHECDCGDNSNHPEHAGRIRSIWSRLQECGLRSQCELVIGRMATYKEIQSVHLKEHVIQFTELSETTPNSMGTFQTLPCGGNGRNHDMVWNSVFSTSALKMAVGSVIELALRVAYGELRNGFAVVRPPGHHASHSEANGFSIFNSVAIAAKQLQDRLHMKKILIVDWDIHHGCGTEKIFYTDPSVLYISLHRYDDGSFFPGTGKPNMVGEGKGKGYNVNVAWSGGLNPPMGDAEYLAAFRTVVMPIAHEFSPNVVLVSAGFDATEGHSAALGGYKVSAKCFGVLTKKLLELAEGRVVLVLEGGYDLTTLCDASQACVNSLIGNEPEPLAEEELMRRPCDNAVRSLEELLRVQSRYWHSVRSMLDTVALPYVKAERRYSAGSDAASALGALTMTVPSRRCFPNEPMEHDEADSI